MSDTSLRSLIERINTDESFRDSLMSDPEGALQQFDLTPAEMVAFATNDEEALRRLSSSDVNGYGNGGLGTGPLNTIVYSTIQYNTTVIFQARSYAIQCGTHGTVNHVPC
jgi:hypothetical protein